MKTPDPEFDTDIQTRVWLAPVRITIVVLLAAFVGAYLAYLIWPLRWVYESGGAYENGLAGRPKSMIPGIVGMLGLLVGGLLLLLNMALAYCTRHRSERWWVLGVLALGVATALAGYFVLGRQDYSDQRFVEGFRDRVRAARLDFASIRQWAATDLKPADFQNTQAWPAAVQRLAPIYVTRMVDDRPGVVCLRWGGAWARWWLTVGPADLQSKLEDGAVVFSEVEPGVFVSYGFD